MRELLYDAQGNVVHEERPPKPRFRFGPPQAAQTPTAPVELKPGGYHIMIMNVAHPLKVGEAVDLVFTFEHAGKVSVTAKVAPIAATKAP